jgi:hypothetical protein
MPEQLLFEYSVIRIVPRPDRDEFINAGVIVYSRPARFLHCVIHLHEAKLMAIHPGADYTIAEKMLRSFEQICMGDHPMKDIASLDIASRFRWLTATRSSVLQTTRPHPGLCADPQEQLRLLAERYLFEPRVA